MKQTLLFLRQWLRYPFTIGAILPSSKRLGWHIARCLPVDKQGYVIELGGGTGSLTQAILASGVIAEKLIVIENNPDFVALLRQRFPHVKIVEADAGCLPQVLAQHGINQVMGIVSGLPLLSLPNHIRSRILQSLVYYIKQSVPVIQFTYSSQSPIPQELMSEHQFFSRKLSTVWLNLPPASIWLYHSDMSRSS